MYKADGYLLRVLLGCALLLMVSSCTRKQAYHGLYEGIRMQNKIGTDPSEKAGKEDEDLSYGQYDERRKELIQPLRPLPQ